MYVLITVGLSGGLGNQMFQFAFGRFLQIETGIELALDASDLFKPGQRNFALSGFQLFNWARIIRRTPLKYFVLLKIVKRLRRMNLSKGLWSRFGLIFEPFPLFVAFPKVESLNKKEIYVAGCWQSELYFQKHRNQILQDFSPKIMSKNAQRWEEDIRKSCSESISIHVRRGDYVTNEAANKAHGVLPLQYYKDSIELICRQTNEPSFYIFTDDVSWTETNLCSLLPKNKMVSGTKCTDLEELILMSRCRHNIMANSSFSWWGAWLNQNPNKITTSPDPWFKLVNSDHTIPGSCIKIKTWLC